MNKRKLDARVASRTVLYSGFLRITRYVFDTEKHDGGRQQLTRDVMERGHAVGVLGVDPVRDEVVLINEFRPGALVAGDYPYTDNVVAGMVEAGESPLVAAAREMQEEAGLELRDAVLIHPGAFVSSGGASEKVALVAGIVDTSGGPGVHGNPHEQEDILTVILPTQEFIDRVRRSQITDFKTLVVGYWLEQNRDFGRRPG